MSAPFRVFLLSPANMSGKRGQLLQRPDPTLELGQRLHADSGAELGDVFSFVSSLYFRGKLAYARAFARPPLAGRGVHVITPCEGLKAPESPLRASDLRRYREPLLRDLQALAPSWAESEVVLLGSIASSKYVELLASVLGQRLLFPSDFVGRGDMSRGGLMLRCVSERRELAYVPLLGAERHGARPQKLTPLRRMA